ncbi:MAG: hypothetical protein LBL93_01910 [Ruminococcus sp.]|jgi:hypothetical protein|nr:hypothetical protein [Ruminococcus sp.]
MSNEVNLSIQRAGNQPLSNKFSDRQADKARELADKFNNSQIKNGKQRIGEYVAAKTPDDTKVKGKYEANAYAATGFEDKLNEIDKALGSDGKKTDKITGEVSECQTCANRKYVDVSDDNSVSFQIPTKVSKNEAAAKVRAHENEHVFHEQAEAAKEGKRIVSQTVEIKTAVCPECGDSYVSGGETETVTAKKPDFKNDDKKSDEKINNDDIAATPPDTPENAGDTTGDTSDTPENAGDTTGNTPDIPENAGDTIGSTPDIPNTLNTEFSKNIDLKMTENPTY